MGADKDLAGQVAVVTGGTRGIGRAVAEALGLAGASLAIIGRSKESLRTVEAELKETCGVAVFGVSADVTDLQAVEESFQQIRSTLGHPSILVNNAGGVESCPFQKIDLSLWEDTLRLNLTAAFLCSREVLGDMLANSFGRIVNVSSTAGLKGYPYVAAYCAAKHGLIGLTRALALETAASGVTANSVCPGYTDTDLVRSSLEKISKKTGNSPESVAAQMLRDVPQGRLIKPAEVASSVAWLCSPAQAAITGHNLVISGGEVM